MSRVFPQTGNIYETAGFSNGRSWGAKNDGAKVDWLSGYSDGVRMALAWNGGADKNIATRGQLLPKLAVGESEKSLDLFYATPENGPIPISVALTVVTAKAGGATAEFLENLTEEYRKTTQQSK